MHLSEYVWEQSMLLTKVKESYNICFGEGNSSPSVLREMEKGQLTRGCSQEDSVVLMWQLMKAGDWNDATVRVGLMKLSNRLLG